MENVFILDIVKNDLRLNILIQILNISDIFPNGLHELENITNLLVHIL